MTERKRVLHCWHDGPTLLEWVQSGRDAYDYIGSTCMLERGHAGPHEFTPDDKITISFPANPDKHRSET